MTSADSLNRRGTEFLIAGNDEAARLHFIAALQVQPDYIPAMANLAFVLGGQNKLVPACVLYRRIVELSPADGEMWNNLGNILFRMERNVESRKALKVARELSPDSWTTWYNTGLLQTRMGDHAGALQSLDRVNALGNTNPDVEEARAHVLLAMGDLPNGLDSYEARWHSMIHLEPWDFHIPEWTGQDLTEKSVLVHAEQGFGDTIMTYRFISHLQVLGARVTIGVQKPLLRLFEAQPGIEVLDFTEMTEADAKKFDYHSPMYSMMRHLRIEKDSISPLPYLTVPKIAVPNVASGKLNVGICWSSGRRGTNMDWRRRVSDLRDWLPIANDPQICLWSLYIDAEAKDDIERTGAAGLVHDVSFALEDFAATAAFIDKLDLVVSVDTAIIHLAGAIGKPVWMLNQYTPCWRWWDLGNGTGQPWYDSVVILPQEESGEWQPQIDLVKVGLESLLEVRAKDLAA